VSRHLFVPHAAAVARTDAAVARPPKEAVVGVHVRSVILLKKNGGLRQPACGSELSCAHVMRASGFLDCVERVRKLSATAGYATSRVYVAADNAMVRQEALAVWGNETLVPAPPHLFQGSESRGKMYTVRSSAATTGALDEMLLLSRGSDGLVVWDLEESSFSAVVASWAAHLARSGAAPDGRRRWLGVHVVSRGCKRIPDEEVDPAVFAAYLPAERGAEVRATERKV
jgi:hypothetical protein